MKYIITALIIGLCAIGFSSMKDAGPSEYSERSLQQFKANSLDFARSAEKFSKTVDAIQQDDNASLNEAREALANCRLRYKRIEYFMEYFFQYPVNLYNRAPVYEVEEPFFEYQSPVGLQVIEALLMEDDAYEHKKEIADQCDVIKTSADDIPALLHNFYINDKQLLEAIRLELIRIISLGITGYDAPLLKTGITESAVALQSVRETLEPLLISKGGIYADSVRYYMNAAIAMLEHPVTFDKFNRLDFLTRAALPLQKHFGSFVKVYDFYLNTHSALDYNAPHLFSRDAIAVGTFSEHKQQINKTALASLGKQLFFEKALSGNGRRNCATCHQPGKYFTDGLIKSKTLDNKHTVNRNAPTLLYAAYQHSQFYDGRAISLEEQIKAVLRNPLEMDADTNKVLAYLNADKHYRQAFKEAYPATAEDINVNNVAVALAAYEQTLSPFNAPFDKYIAGDTLALTSSQKKGFNLFMGKAQCGTCHFAPVFNGLLPPYYEVSEVEVLGVPKNRGKRHPVADVDSGRYHFFPISFNNGAFKTTSVRNAGMTAPYMHNGVFKNLKQVVHFYNKGGGRGLGLDIPAQTLSDKSINLTNTEIYQIVSFINSLTDDIEYLK